jgi:hypothetical protein
MLQSDNGGAGVCGSYSPAADIGARKKPVDKRETPPESTVTGN